MQYSVHNKTMEIIQKVYNLRCRYIKNSKFNSQMANSLASKNRYQNFLQCGNPVCVKGDAC